MLVDDSCRTYLDRETLVFAVVAIDDRGHPNEDPGHVTDLLSDLQDGWTHVSYFTCWASHWRGMHTKVNLAMGRSVCQGVNLRRRLV